MKRFITTFLAAMMVVASMATTAFAADYSLTMSVTSAADGSVITDGAELKKGDIIDVITTISDIEGSNGLSICIAYDTDVFATATDEETFADANYYLPDADWDNSANGAKYPFIPYAVYKDRNEVASNRTMYSTTLAPELRSVKASTFADGYDGMKFGFAQLSGSVTPGRGKSCKNIQIAGIRLEVIADVTADLDTTIEIRESAITTPTSTVSEKHDLVVEPLNLTIKSDAPAGPTATALKAWDTGLGLLVIAKVDGTYTTKGVELTKDGVAYVLPETSSDAGYGPKFAVTAPASTAGYYGLYIRDAAAGNYVAKAYADEKVEATGTNVTID